jgi:hypothetical protein
MLPFYRLPQLSLTKEVAIAKIKVTINQSIFYSSATKKKWG